MSKHSWGKLDSFPLVFVVVLAIAVFVPFIIALSSGHVTPYVPYISEGGGEFPEAGIFSVCIILSSFLSQWIILIRYLVVETLNTLIGDDMNTFLNKVSFAIGGFSTLAMLVVASYPASTISQVHNSAAGASCVCYVVYLVCQTVISFRTIGCTSIFYCRLVITIFSILSLIFITVFGLIGSSEWVADYWAGKKTPEDKGFAFYVASASFEWISAFLFATFFSTYIAEFKKSTLHFNLEIPGFIEHNKPRLSDLDIHPRRRI